MLADIYDPKLVLFSGKGGVGKTTISSAFALSCARRGQRTLLIELNAKDKMSQLFGSEEISTEISEIEENLYAVNATPTSAMQEYALMILRVKLIYRAVFENRIVKSFLKVVPGLNELLLLGKAYYHAIETNPDGSPTWDKVVIDAPATGHGIFFLQIPSVITSIIGSGPMFDEATRIQTLLSDPASTAINLITLAEDMPVNETLMLKDVVQNKLQMPLGSIIANGIYPELFDPPESQWIENLPDCDEKSPYADICGYIDAAKFRSQRVAMQQHYVERLKTDSELSVYEIPYYFSHTMNFATISKIAVDLETQHANRNMPGNRSQG